MPDKPLVGCHSVGSVCCLSLGLWFGGSKTTKVMYHCHHFISRVHNVNMTYLTDIDHAHPSEVGFIKLRTVKSPFISSFPSILFERQSPCEAYNYRVERYTIEGRIFREMTTDSYAQEPVSSPFKEMHVHIHSIILLMSIQTHKYLSYNLFVDKIFLYFLPVPQFFQLCPWDMHSITSL